MKKIIQRILSNNLKDSRILKLNQLLLNEKMISPTAVYFNTINGQN